MILHFPAIFKGSYIWSFIRSPVEGAYPDYKNLVRETVYDSDDDVNSSDLMPLYRLLLFELCLLIVGTAVFPHNLYGVNLYM